MNESTGKDLIPIKSFRDLVGPGLAGIPGVGGPLSALWSQWDTNRRFNRIEETIHELTRLLALPAYRLATDDLCDEDMQILEAALHRVQMAHTEEKRVLFARLVASCWTNARQHPFDERILFVNALSAFNEYHLRTLTILNDEGLDGAVAYATLRDTVASAIPSEIEKDSVMVPTLEMLAAQYGFIQRAWGLNGPSYKSAALMSRNLSAEGLARKCNHAITPLGERFMTSLEENGIQQPALGNDRNSKCKFHEC